MQWLTTNNEIKLQKQIINIMSPIEVVTENV